MDKEDVRFYIYIYIYIYMYIYIYIYIYIYNEILLSHKKEEILPLATTWMNLKGIMLSEIRQTERSRFHRNKNRMVVARAGGRGKWGDVGQRVQMFSYKMF